MHWTERIQLWAVATVVVAACTPTATSTPTPVTAPVPTPSSYIHDVFTVEHHNYTLPILLVRENVASSSTHAINPSSFDLVEYVEEEVAVDNKSSSEGYKEEQLSELFNSTHEENTDNVLIQSESDAPLSESDVEESNDTLPVNSTKVNENPKPNPEVLEYFRQLIADINSASKSGPEMYKILSAAEGDVKSVSNKSDMQSPSIPDHYLLESESAPPTLLYSFPFASFIPEKAVRNASRKSKPSLQHETPDKATTISEKDLSITFESPDSFITKSSVRPAGKEQISTPPTEHNTTHPDSSLRLRFLESTNHSLPILEDEEVLDSAASHTGEVYYAQLPERPLADDHLPATLYQYDVAPPHLDPEPVPHYAFEYVVRDPRHGGLHGHSETRRGQDTHGRYFVLLPDGRLQTVTYIANERGYFPQVVYTGEAKPAIPIKPPLEIHKPFHQTLKPFYVKDKQVMPHAVLFKPKSAYLIKYGKPFPTHPPTSHGISFKPKYVTPASVQPLLKPTQSPGPTPLPPPVFSPPPIPVPIPDFPSEHHKHPPPPPSITRVVSGPTLSPFSHYSTTVSHKPFPHPTIPTLGPFISPQPHIITKSHHSPFPHPSTVTTTHSKLSHLFPPITTVTPKPSPRPIITTFKPDFSPHHPPTVTTSRPKLPPFLPTLTTTSEPFPHPTFPTHKPGLSPHPHIVTTLHSRTPPHPPALTTHHPNFSPFLPTITTVSSNFSPSHPSFVNSLGPTHFPHRPRITTLPPNHLSRPSLIASSLPKFSPRHPFLTTSDPEILSHPPVITSPRPTLFPHPHLIKSPRPAPFHPTIITTSTPRPKPHPLPFHLNQHHPTDHDFHHPFLGVSPRPTKDLLDAHASKTTRPSVTTTTTTVVTSLPEPEPHHTLLVSDTERPRRLVTTTFSKERIPTLKPKPLLTPTESSSELPYSILNHNYEKSIFVTTLPESGETLQKVYRFPKSSDVLVESIPETVKPGDFEHPFEVFGNTPPTYTSSGSLKYHSVGREGHTNTPAPEVYTPTPASFSKASGTELTTIPNDIESHGSPHETPFSPSKLISIDYTPKRPPLTHQKPTQSHTLPPSTQANLHKYSIDIKLKPRAPRPAFPSHGTLFRTTQSSPSSPPDTPVPHRQIHSHSHLDRETDSPQPRDSISFVPTSFNYYPSVDLESFIPHSDILMEPWSQVPQTLSLIKKEPFQTPSFDPHTRADSSELFYQERQLQSWKPLAGPTGSPSAYYTPSTSSSVNPASSANDQH